MATRVEIHPFSLRSIRDRFEWRPIAIGSTPPVTRNGSFRRSRLGSAYDNLWILRQSNFSKSARRALQPGSNGGRRDPTSPRGCLMSRSISPSVRPAATTRARDSSRPGISSRSISSARVMRSSALISRRLSSSAISRAATSITVGIAATAIHPFHKKPGKPKPCRPRPAALDQRRGKSSTREPNSSRKRSRPASNRCAPSASSCAFAVARTVRAARGWSTG